MRKLTNILFLAVLATQLGNTNCGQALRDPGYDLWCGDDLCAWKVERGEIKRVATWHEGDAGVPGFRDSAERARETLGHMAAGIANPGDVGEHRSGVIQFAPEIE